LPKTVFTGAHEALVEVLIKARKAARLTQTDVAERLGKDQTFVSLIERSQRRVDVLEFVAIAKAMGQDPVDLFGKVYARLPKRFDI
jgi:transcriptional regulator with XRE-family HTH domain